MPLKFRVCDSNGNSIGTPGVVVNLRQTMVKNGVGSINETSPTITPDNVFRWDPTDELWILNLGTKDLFAGKTYTYEIELNDLSVITFNFGLK